MTPKNVISEESKDFGMSDRDNNTIRGIDPKPKGFLSPKAEEISSKKSDFDKAVKELGFDNNSSHNNNKSVMGESQTSFNKMVRDLGIRDESVPKSRP